MKKKLLLTFALLLTAATGAWADGSWTSGGCDVTLVGGTLTVSKSSSGDGAMENYASSSNQPWKNSSNDITSVVIGDGVTSIGNNAFRECLYLTSVTIGSNVGSIGQDAFNACLSLASVSIPASVTSIGNYAFVSCGSWAAALVVAIADGSLLSSIGTQAFWYANLASFNIPASVTSIGKWAFRYCSNLSSVIIQAPSLTTYGEDPFDDNKDGRMIYVPINSVNTYKTYWAKYENYITGHPLTAHAAVAATCTTAGNTAYWECEICHKYFSDENGGPEIAANGWVIPATGHTIVNNICTGCGKYGTCGTSGNESDVTWELTGESSNYTLTISGTGATPGYNWGTEPWHGYKDGITSVVIENGVTGIGQYAFSGYSHITSLTIGNDLQTIGVRTFENCTGLTSFILPASMTSIGDMAFGGCSNLSTIIVRATSVPTCDNDAFRDNKAGRKIYVPTSSYNTYTTTSHWSDYTSDIIGFNGTCGATGHEWDVLWALTGESPNYTLNIMKVGETGAMANYSNGDAKPWNGNRTNIKTIIVGDGVTHIGDHAFDYCAQTSLTIGSDVTTIGDCAFHNCGNITSIVIPNSVETIGASAFEFLSSLTTVIIGSGLKSIGAQGFHYNSKLSSVVIRAASLTSYGEVFNAGKIGRKIYVPAASVDTYKAGWTTYANDIIGYNGKCGATGHEWDVLWALTGESPNCTLNIMKVGETGAMMDCGDGSSAPWYSNRGDITSVVIGDGVTTIGAHAFGQNNGNTLYTHLTSLTIGNDVTTIGDYAFYYCTGLTSIVIPNSVQTIKSYAFEGCSGVTSLTIGSGVTTLENHAFYGLGITSLVIPANVTTFGNSVFNSCSNLKSVLIRRSSLTSYGVKVFDNNASGRKILVPTGAENTYKAEWNSTDKGNYVNDIYGYQNCGETGHESDVVWAVTGESPNCTLFVCGTGAMKNCDLENVPWDNERNNITSVVIGDGVTAIGQYAFYDCSNLASVTIGSSLQTIGVWAFYNCSMTSVTLPASVISIGNSSFLECNSLTSVTLNSNPQIQSNAFPGSATVTMNLTANPVGDDKWMTFFNDGYHFKADENTTVYKGTLSDSSVSLTEVADKIVTKGNAVILKSTGNPVMTLNSAASSDDYAAATNDLQGVSNVNGLLSNGSIYVLNNGKSGVGFYKLKSDKTLGYGKAYLSSSNAPSYLNFEEDETTSLSEELRVKNEEFATAQWYTLEGRKLIGKPSTKGMYIVNGKKVIIK